MRKQLLSLLFLPLIFLSGCTPKEASPTYFISIPITGEDQARISSQDGPKWVLVSGVDDHGLVIDAHVNLYAAADLNSQTVAQVETGTPVTVLEIRHLGPQQLVRFYRVQTTSGISGWVSDYFIRRHAYLFNIDGTFVPIYESRGGAKLAEAPNVSPVFLVDPRNDGWWQIVYLDGSVTGWVPASHVKESSEEAFLLNFSPGHSHDAP